MICSLERTSDEIANPRIAEATQVAATVANSSTVAATVPWPSSRPPRVGVLLPITTIAVMIADCTIAKPQKTPVLASRYAATPPAPGASCATQMSGHVARYLR